MLEDLASRIEVRVVSYSLPRTRPIPLFEQWDSSELCGVIVGTGIGKAFSAGGDVAGSLALLV